jgi:hypothetical protein
MEASVAVVIDSNNSTYSQLLLKHSKNKRFPN